MTLCARQHERGALYIMILTDSEETHSEEQFLALDTLHQRDESAVAAHIQREAIAKEGPLHKELFHLLETVMQGGACQ